MAKEKKLTDEQVAKHQAVLDAHRGGEVGAVRTRLFVIDGGAALKARKLAEKHNEEVHEVQQRIAHELGVHSLVNMRHGRIGVMIAAGTKAAKGWKQLKFRKDQYAEVINGVRYLGWEPDGTKAGQENTAALKAAPEMLHPETEALKAIGLPNPNIPYLVQGHTGYCITAAFLPMTKKMVVRVPWRDVAPVVLKSYGKLHKGGFNMSTALDYLSWELPKGENKHVKEVRESEFHRQIEKNEDRRLVWQKEQAKKAKKKGKQIELA